MKKLLVFFLFLSFSYAYSQDDSNIYQKYLDESVLDFIYTSRPLVEIGYGYGKPMNRKVNQSFENIGNWDLKLGKSEQKNFKNILVDLNERYVFGSFIASSNQNISDPLNGIETSAYRFGFGSRDGIGFGGSFLSVVPYISQDFVWTKLTEYNSQIPTESMAYAQVPELEDYLGTFRFGDKASYGFKVELASMLQFSANYETSVVYRRHLFWYWSGSYIVSQVGYNALAYFTDDIVDNSPVIGTVFNFLLKAGYQYGYYLLRKENMNWPFNTSGNEAPLTYETFNVGFTFLF